MAARDQLLTLEQLDALNRHLAFEGWRCCPTCRGRHPLDPEFWHTDQECALCREEKQADARIRGKKIVAGRQRQLAERRARIQAEIKRVEAERGRLAPIPRPVVCPYNRR